MLLTQLALNVFGSLDLLPFTGVTFPFVSRGGSSLLSCWLLMAFIKGADNRREASFAVRPTTRIKSAVAENEDALEDEEEDSLYEPGYEEDEALYDDTDGGEDWER